MLLMEEAGRALLPGPFSRRSFWPAPFWMPSPAPSTRTNTLHLSAGESPRDGCYSGSERKLESGRRTNQRVRRKTHRRKTLCPRRRRRRFYHSRSAQRRLHRGSQGPRREDISDVRHGSDAQTLRRRIQQHACRRNRPTANLPRALDIATAALAAELVGGMQRTLDLTVEYAKTRKQFGKPIGMFQAVQHQCADMYLETESARSAVYYAGWALEENSPDAPKAVSIAKMYASDAARTVGNRGIQIHGGMGFTWENDIHLYYRRAKASETAFGDATFHRERIASLVIDSDASPRRARKNSNKRASHDRSGSTHKRKRHRRHHHQ